MISLNVLARAPTPGRVKTRLIPTLGPGGAAEAHKALTLHVMGVARNWAEQKSNRRVRLWATPSSRHPFFHALAPPRELFWQPAGDLGARLAHIAARGFSAGDRAVMLLGADAGGISPDDLETASARLSGGVPAVVIPAEDGGYLLIGFSRRAGSVFRGIPWGTTGVMAATRRRLRAARLRWRELPMRWDVDGPTDWARFMRGPGG